MLASQRSAMQDDMTHDVVAAADAWATALQLASWAQRRDEEPDETELIDAAMALLAAVQHWRLAQRSTASTDHAS